MTSAEQGASRTYIVLERLTLADRVRDALVEVENLGIDLDDLLGLLPDQVIYEEVYETEARNTEHAYRLTAKAVFSDDEDYVPTLVAVATRMFQPQPVRVTNRQQVSIG